MQSDDLGEKKLLQKCLNFSMWASYRLRNIALKFFSLGCSSFSRINVCEKLGFSQPYLCLHMFVEQETGRSYRLFIMYKVKIKSQSL